MRDNTCCIVTTHNAELATLFLFLDRYCKLGLGVTGLCFRVMIPYEESCNNSIFLGVVKPEEFSILSKCAQVIFWGLHFCSIAGFVKRV